MRNEFSRWLVDNGARDFNMASKAGWFDFCKSGPRPAPPVVTAESYAQLSNEERQDFNSVRAVWNANPPPMRTAQLSHAFDILDQVMASNHRDSNRLRGSAVIDAAPALGKTTIATHYARNFHLDNLEEYGRETADGSQRIPVAFIPLGSAVTLKSLNQKILSFYGHPGVYKATTSRLADLAVDCVRTCQTRLIVIDDLHFVDFRRQRGQEVSNHLKGLANEMPATFLYVGVNLRSKRFFDEGLLGEDAAYAQTSRRATRVPVSPFTNLTTDGMRAWCDLLEALENHILLLKKKPHMLVQLAKELFMRTQGNIGSLTFLLDHASYLAIHSGVENIDAEVLAAAKADNAAETSRRKT
ncbi:TniB family NTP-binding protein [Nesterenkonia sp. CF4.4]|uniref:TniB family NTP-binding protein n=1 Tax=Nesterenkonia sp. CF4.4 TaxID=3373079 RepID=UPI003EE704ED